MELSDRLQSAGRSAGTTITAMHNDQRGCAGGNTDLKKQLGLTIVGPKADAERIPGIDVPLGDGDTWQFGDLEMRVMDTPGHTRGHITLWFPQAGAVFPGTVCTCGSSYE